MRERTPDSSSRVTLTLQEFDFALVRDEYPDRWERANPSDTSVSIVDEGVWQVRIDEGDQHEVFLANKGSKEVGFCDCDGFKHHTTGDKGPCAHLCVVRKLSVTSEGMIPDVADIEAGAEQPSDDQDQAATADPTDQDDVSSRGNDDRVSEPVDEDEPREIRVASTQKDPATVDDAQEFVEDIAGVPPAFVVEMGRGSTSKPYITKEGLNYIAYEQGLQTRAEPISPSWEEPEGVAAWRGIVEDGDGGRWVDVGTAHLEHEDMAGAESNLDELASTRATNRALRLATGYGFASIEELGEPSPEDVVENGGVEADVAKANIRAFRSQPIGNDRAKIEHTELELLWFSGAWIGALRGLDRDDVDLDEGTLTFHHRPETGTPIKPAFNPERKIGMPSDSVEVLRDYVDECRIEGVFDEYGREPFLTTEYGRLSDNTARRYSYFATVPCRGTDCPHGKEQPTCDWYRLRGASGCPSSRSPHRVRTGAITNLRNSGWSLDEVAERVNTSPERIKRYYDFPDIDEQYRERREGLVDQLRIDDEPTDDDQDNEN